MPTCDLKNLNHTFVQNCFSTEAQGPNFGLEPGAFLHTHFTVQKSLQNCTAFGNTVQGEWYVVLCGLARFGIMGRILPILPTIPNLLGVNGTLQWGCTCIAKVNCPFRSRGHRKSDLLNRFSNSPHY